MNSFPLVTIIITSYNYGRFLADTIDSALSQTYPHTEVIIVDDGSSDNSWQIIGSYGERVVPVLKKNGGQASAFNAGFRLSKGSLVLFLDSDDSLLPTAAEEVVNLFDDPETVKVHWPLWVLDEHGRNTGKVMPSRILSEGDLRATVMRDGPNNYNSPPSSGNAWARKFLEQIFPMPEREFRVFADAYPIQLAPFYGPIRALNEPQGFYRIHGENNYLAVDFDQTLRLELKLFDVYSSVLRRYFRRRGITVDTRAWKTNSWWHRLHQAAREIIALVPPGDAFILVDEGRWGMDETLAGRRRLLFSARNGECGERPRDDEGAIGELERLREAGASFVVFGWPAFWWFDYYSGLNNYLCSHFRCLLENERLVMFDLRTVHSV